MKTLHNILLVGILVLFAIVALSACTNNEDDDSPLPTQEFRPVEDPVIITPPDTASTDTPADVTPPTPVVLATSTPRGLPPTWTPTPTETFAPTLDTGATWTASTPVPAATLNPGCATFNLDRNLTTATFVVGDTPTLAWTVATGATLYRVFVYNENGLTILHEQLVQGTSVQINPDVFPSEGVYIWTVAPLDPFGIQMCTDLGDGLVVQRR